MEIKSYNRLQLNEFIHSDFFKQSEYIPISRHRAISQIQNPDCSEEDILLWAAYEENQLLGYVGVLPGQVFVKGKTEKIYWLSCFWVHKSCRNNNLASVLFFPLIKLYRDRLFISNFIPSLEKTYQSLGVFQPTLYKRGERFYVRFAFAEILPKRYPKTLCLKPFYIFIDTLLNFMLSVKWFFYKPLKIKNKIIENKEFDEEFQSFISSCRKGEDYIKRNTEHFNWILTNPWIIVGKNDKESKRYYFSSKSCQFEYNSLKIYDKESLVGYVLLKTRDKNLTVSYMYSTKETMTDITSYILHKSQKEKIKTITTFDGDLSAEIKKHKERYIVSKKIKRPYILTKKITVSPDSFQEGDGDNIFT